MTATHVSAKEPGIAPSCCDPAQVMPVLFLRGLVGSASHCRAALLILHRGPLTLHHEIPLSELEKMGPQHFTLLRWKVGVGSPTPAAESLP